MNEETETKQNPYTVSEEAVAGTAFAGSIKDPELDEMMKEIASKAWTNYCARYNMKKIGPLNWEIAHAFMSFYDILDRQNQIINLAGIKRPRQLTSLYAFILFEAALRLSKSTDLKQTRNEICDWIAGMEKKICSGGV